MHILGLKQMSVNLTKKFLVIFYFSMDFALYPKISLYILWHLPYSCRFLCLVLEQLMPNWFSQRQLWWSIIEQCFFIQSTRWLPPCWLVKPLWIARPCGMQQLNVNLKGRIHHYLQLKSTQINLQLTQIQNTVKTNCEKKRCYLYRNIESCSELFPWLEIWSLIWTRFSMNPISDKVKMTIKARSCKIPFQKHKLLYAFRYCQMKCNATFIWNLVCKWGGKL